MTAYNDLMAYQRQTQALNEIAKRQSWDQQTMMPSGAAGQRAEERAALEAVLHDRNSAARVGAWLDEAQVNETGKVERAQLRHIRFNYDRTTRIPSDLATEYAKATSIGQEVWAQARAADDVAQFLPTLKHILALSREMADAWSDGGDRYDALLQSYEPGTTGDEIAAIFDAMRPRLVALRDKVLGADTPPAITGNFDPGLQMDFAGDLAHAFGYDPARGRIDKAVHPFMSGSGTDVRVTTRTSESYPFDCFYSTIHEVGHATYEQGIDPAYHLTPLGRGVSMGVHESQSRFYENQLGRSRAFTGWMFSQMRDRFGDFGIADAEEFYATANRVSPGHIRTESDEIHYNLHIMMRFDLERALVSGDLALGDLESAWNDRFEADFATRIDKPSNGVLQDVHWSVGYIGYFPTYSLGNVYAGCLYDAMRADVPDFEEALGKGDTSLATTWLHHNVQTHGGLYEPREVITRAAGRAPDERPLLTYLETKFSDLYRI